MLYELMLVISPTADGKTFVSGVEKTIKDSGASSVKVENLGKKQLAYSIKRNTEAEYYLFNFEAEGTIVKALNDKLRLEQEALLRYLIIKSSAKVTPPAGSKVTAKVTVETKKPEKIEQKLSTKTKQSPDKKTPAKLVKKTTKAKAVRKKNGK